MKEVVISPTESGQRFDKFLGKYLTGAGRSFLYKMLRKKNITLNGRKALGSEMLCSGDVVRIYFSDETFEKFRVNNDEKKSYLPDYSLDIIYEDDNIVIANKPAGILSQKASLSDISFNDLIVDYIKKKLADPEAFRAFTPSIANRLDRNTSGIILAGKSLEGLQTLSEALKERKADKYYLAICYGEFKENISFKGYLKKDEESNLVSISTSDNGGDHIVTNISPIDSSNGYTLAKIELVTGKTHQIRATLKELGYPIVGDRKYGSKDSVNARRQMLHAYEIIIDGASYIAPIPNDFQFMLDKLSLSINNYGNI